MMKMLRKKRKGGFTLIELIVVIAILGIIALIAIPRFAGIQEQSRIKADAATANQIINSIRIYEADNDLTTLPTGDANLRPLAATYMTIPSYQSGIKGAFVITASGTPQKITVTYGSNSTVEQ